MALTTYTWTNAVNGTWETASNWTSVPGDAPETTAAFALINVTGANYTVTLSASDNFTINVLDENSSNATVETDGALTATTVDVTAGLLSVVSGGSVTATTFDLGDGSGTATVSVSGATSLLSFASGLNDGQTGTGVLQALNGGAIQLTGTKGITLGTSLGAIGSITVSGTDAGSGAAAMLNEGTKTTGMAIGGAGQGTVTVSNDGTIQMNGTTGLVMGTVSTGSGQLTITGTGAVLSMGTATGQIAVGMAGTSTSTLLVSNGGAIQMSGTGGVNVGVSAGALGLATITDTGSLLNLGTTSGGLNVGQAGTGTLLVEAGGEIELNGTGGFNVGQSANAIGLVTITGTGSAIDTGTTAGGISIGQVGTGTLQVLSGGALTMGAQGFGVGVSSGAVGTVTVSGTGSTITVSGTKGLNIGPGGTGYLTIAAGGMVSTGANPINIANQSIGSGTVTVGGGGATLEGGDLQIAGSSATAVLEVDTGGSVNAGTLGIGAHGTLIMGGGNLSVSTGLPPSSGLITGFGTISAGVANTGSIVASGGVLDITGQISGTGSDTIAGGATLEADGGLFVSQSVTFATSTTAAALDLGQILLSTESFGLINMQNGDEIIISNGSTVTGEQWQGNGTLVVDTSGQTYTFTGITTPDPAPVFTFGTNDVELVSCFSAGTLIETARGPVAVEALAVGERVMTADDEDCEPIVWIGRREVNCRAHPRPETVWPVRVRAGAFGGGLPVRDLWLSPDHAVFVNGALVPVKLLVNGGSIAQVKRGRVEYFHVELPRHAIILAEGLPVESYLDVGDRATFDDGATVRLFPDFVGPDTALAWETRGAAPLVTHGEALAAARRAVAPPLFACSRVRSVVTAPRSIGG